MCLRSFVHVCESGTIARAAAELGDTAPAVSQQLAKLEHALAVTLFDRVGGRLRRTTLAELAGLPWLLNGDGSHCSTAVLRILDDAGVRPTIAGSVSDNHALLGLVAAGHGACVVPALVLAGGAPGVTVTDVDLDAARTVLAVTRRSSAGRGDDVVTALASAVPRSSAHSRRHADHRPRAVALRHGRPE